METAFVSEPDRRMAPFTHTSAATTPGNAPPPNPPLCHAITLRKAFFEYKDVTAVLTTGRPVKHTVLKNFSMTVERGQIYGLLGASGCGKTTILRAIVGEHRLTAGQIRVLGHEPRSPASGIPGTTVGYMPQELSLLEELSIIENLRYYGWIEGMDSEEVDARAKYLTNLLELPDKNRLVANLSGGQRRRVSFAIALLHSPPILVLDEPTVGVDPLLRESIWEYFTNVAKKGGTTVLITTHYIEEASQADTVGLIRNGVLIAEETPNKLLQSFQCANLEDVLLKLCLRQSGSRKSDPENDEDFDFSMISAVNEEDVKNSPTEFIGKTVPAIKRVRALMWKNTVSLSRQYIYAFILLFLPSVIITIYAMGIGTPPRGLTVSVFNQEIQCNSGRILLGNNYTQNASYCQMTHYFSCGVLSLLERREILPVLCDTKESAEEEVRRGRAWAAIFFEKNFTAAMLERAASPTSVTEEVVDQGTVSLALDQSDNVISLTIQSGVVEAIKRTLSDFDDKCHNLRHIKDFPLQFKTPIYGSKSTSFRDVSIPGIVASAIFMFPLTATLTALLPEKIQGTLERSLVSGVTMTEVLVSHFATQSFAVVVQVGCMFIVVHGFFQITMIGSFGTVFLISLPLSLAGMMLGFILASFCTTMTAASMIGAGLYFTCIFTSGALWPVEGVSPEILRPVFWMMPLTMSTHALRYVSLRGWTLGSSTVQLSIANSLLWAVIFLAVLVVYWRCQRR